MLFWGLRKGSQKRYQKMIPKWTPKGALLGAKRVKKCIEKGVQKKLRFLTPLWRLRECDFEQQYSDFAGSDVSEKTHFWSLFWSSFSTPREQKRLPKSISKLESKMTPIWSTFGTLFWDPCVRMCMKIS